MLHNPYGSAERTLAESWSESVLNWVLSGATRFAHELQHLDYQDVENPPELLPERKRNGKLPQKIAFYALLALIPVVILLLMTPLSGR